MSGFIVSARKYRPQSFDEMVGQEHISSTLQNALRDDKLAHAFLFCGPRGVGKTSCARILARVVNCENLSETFAPCGTCKSCTSIAQNASFTITELDAASHNSVDQMRMLTDQVRIPPQLGRYKVYIIDEVHMLSTAAFNAFLKTLEEPPPYAIFILATTEKHKIIPTILSRCQIFDFNRHSVSEIVSHLTHISKTEGITVEDQAYHVIAEKADGAMRDALSIFDRLASSCGKEISYDDVIRNLNILDYDHFFDMSDHIASGDRAGVLNAFGEILSKGFEGDLLINGLAGHFRNLLVCKNPKTVALLETSDSLKSRYAEQAQKLDERLLLNALDLCHKGDVQYRMARNKRLHTEIVLLKLAQLMSKISGEKKTPELTQTVTKTAPIANPRPIENKIGDGPVADEIHHPSKKDATSGITTTVLTETSAEAKLLQPKTISPEKLKISTPNIQSTVQASVNESLISKFKDDLNQREKVKPKAPLTLEKIQAAYDDYVGNLESEARKTYLNKFVLELQENDVLWIYMPSEMTHGALRNEKTLLKTLREKLDEPTLTFEAKIDPERFGLAVDNEVKRAPTDKDRYLEVAQENPAIEALRKSLDLKLDGGG